MSNDDAMSGPAGARRVPRQGMGGSPAGSTLSIVLAVVAVVAGFLILRNITDDSGGATGAGDVGAVDDADAGQTTLPDPSASVVDSSTTSTTSTVPRVTEGATVVVANVNSVGGSAGGMSRTLELAGYTVGDPVNGSIENIAESLVYYDETVAAALDVANSVAVDLGGLAVAPVPTPPPTESAQLDGAGVLVMLGDNQAGKTIEELQAAADPTAAEGATTDTPATGTAPAPAVAGSTTEVTTTTTTVP